MREWLRSGPEPGKDYEDIWYDAADGVTKITINRPERRTAFRPAAQFELSPAFNVARDDPGIGVIILPGAGEADAFKEKRPPDLGEFPGRP